MAYYADIGQFDSWSLGYVFVENRVSRSEDASPEVQECSGEVRNTLLSHQILQGRGCSSSHPRYQHLTKLGL